MEQEEQEKAFVYRWHIEETKKYYIGSSKGIKPYYTHSSNDKEFCSYVPNSKSSVAERREFLANMPEGITREIITYGTYEKMLTLERTLQLHAKEHCWEEYYNDNVCDGVYHGFGSGKDHYLFGKTLTPETKQKMSEAKSDKNNPSYKHGRSVGASKDPKIGAAYAKVKYANMTPEKKEEYLRRCNRYEKERRANETPEQTAERQRKDRDRKRANRAKMTPEELKAFDKEKNDKFRAKKKAERTDWVKVPYKKKTDRGGEGTLDAFFG